MKNILTKKRIIFLKIFAIVCLSTYSCIILISNFDKEFNQFLILTTIVFIISLIVIAYKLINEIKENNSNANKIHKIKFIELFDFIGGLLVIIMILLSRFKIIPKEYLDIVYIFIALILSIIIILKVLKKGKKNNSKLNNNKEL